MKDLFEDTEPEIDDGLASLNERLVTPRLLHGDCQNLFTTIHDDSIDMVLCDLPYGNRVSRVRVAPGVPHNILWYNRWSYTKSWTSGFLVY